MASGRSVVPAGGSLPITCPRAPFSDYCSIDSPNSRLVSASASWASSSVMPAQLGYVVPLLAEREHDGDGAAVEDPLAGPGVGARSPGRRARSRSRPVADLGLEAGGLELLDGGRLRQAEDAGRGGVAGPAEPPGADAGAADEEQGEDQEDRPAAGARRPVAGRPADEPGARVRPGPAPRAVGVGRARSCARGWSAAVGRAPSGPRTRRRRTGRRSVSSGRPGVLDGRTTGTGARRQVGLELRVLAHAAASAWLTRCTWWSSTAGVGRPLARGRGRWPGRPARRRTAGCRATVAGRRRHVLVDVLVGDLDRRLALVRLRAGEQLVEHDAGGVHVGAGVGAAVDDQLGGEVGDGADQDAAGRGVLGVGADRLGQAEVGDLDPAVVGDQDVLGLDVAVDQAGAVGGGQRREDRLERARAPGPAASGSPCGSRRAGCGPGPAPWRGRRCRRRRPGRRPRRRWGGRAGRRRGPRARTAPRTRRRRRGRGASP